MKALRIHVERIVRPIRGGVLRKNKMREELLAHLMTAYAEEAKSASSEDEAVARAARRLGEPDALRKDLQGTVPLWERLAHLPVPLPSPELADAPDLPAVKYAARFTGIVLSWLTIGAPVLIGLVFVVNSTAVSAATRPRPFDLDRLIHALPCMTSMAALLGVALFVSLIAFDLTGGRRVVSPASTSPAFVKACFVTGLWVVAISLFLTMAIPFGEHFLRGPGDAALSDVFAAIAKPLVLLWLGLPLGTLLFVTPAMAFERHQYEQWGCLRLDEASSEEPGHAIKQA